MYVVTSELWWLSLLRLLKFQHLNPIWLGWERFSHNFYNTCSKTALTLNRGATSKRKTVDWGYRAGWSPIDIQACNPSTTRNGRLRCSVSRLTQFPPLQHPFWPILQPTRVGDSGFGTGRPSTCHQTAHERQPNLHIFLPPSLGYRRPLHRPDVRDEEIYHYNLTLLHEEEQYGVTVIGATLGCGVWFRDLTLAIGISEMIVPTLKL